MPSLRFFCCLQPNACELMAAHPSHDRHGVSMFLCGKTLSIAKPCMMDNQHDGSGGSTRAGTKD